MATFTLKTRNKPDSVGNRGQLLHNVRVWRQSPEDLILQIWSGHRYTIVSLYPDEARDIAAALREHADAIDAKRVFYVTDDSVAAKKPCFSIRRTSDDEMVCYSATHAEAVRYIQGTLAGAYVGDR